MFMIYLNKVYNNFGPFYIHTVDLFDLPYRTRG